MLQVRGCVVRDAIACARSSLRANLATFDVQTHALAMKEDSDPSSKLAAHGFLVIIPYWKHGTAWVSCTLDQSFISRGKARTFNAPSPSRPAAHYSVSSFILLGFESRKQQGSKYKSVGLSH